MTREQLSLAVSNWQSWDGARREFLDQCREAIKAAGQDWVAGQLDLSPSHMSHALSPNPRGHKLTLDMAPVILALAPNEEPLAYLAKLRGMEPTPVKTPTREEMGLAMLAAVERQPEHVKRAYYAMALDELKVRR